MVYLSKTRYCNVWRCPKYEWLNEHMPEKCVIDADTQARMVTGNEVGDLAMHLFGDDFVEVSSYKDGKIDNATMVKRTQEEIAKGTNIICEASFSYNGLFCSVDILKKEDDGYSLYEVKSSSHDDNQIYLADIAYQKYVLEHCGIKLKNVFLVTINSKYIYDGITLNLNKLFNITNKNTEVLEEEKNVKKNIALANKYLSDNNEPDIDLNMSCHEPYDCGFFEYCTEKLPTPSIFDVSGINFSDKLELYKKGLITYKDLYDNNVFINKMKKGKNNIKLKKAQQQIEYELFNKGTYIDKDAITKFVQSLYYPLYFLDFETMKFAIPKYKETKPNQRIPFQYSLHYIETENGELKHKEFLAESGIDPRRSLAEQLVKDIPNDVCVTAYNKSFECGVIKELADAFPNLADHLLNIREHIIDLEFPFDKRLYYNRDMKGRSTIKFTSPAIYPQDTSLDYHNLDDVHNGGEAMTIFPSLVDKDPEEQKKLRKSLLKYCELDTYSMVKIWEALIRIANE